MTIVGFFTIKFTLAVGDTLVAIAIVERWPLWRGCQYGATFQNNNNNNNNNNEFIDKALFH